ncbi:lipid A 3-O-deacylase [Tenacibaculum sp. 190524A02b]|uniref:Lipid A 3-O-deacylase n=1 Tax=Tenacibaculum vairaonense TaxID=3137860 RepID=A0ABM9PHP1_9FLAO
MKKNITFLLCLFSTLTFSQRKYAKEFNFSNDNDLYISTYQDRYYTNGMFFTYRYLSKKNNFKAEKKIYEFALNHKMYTPFKATVESHLLHDRPFASYLYGSFGINNFYKNNSFIKFSGEIGVVGPSALGADLQHVIHSIYGFREATGWNYQIANALGLNFKGNYTKLLTNEKNSLFDISWINTANAGTVFTNVSTGLFSRIGFKPLQKLINSIAFNSNLNNKYSNYNNEIESFIYLKPSIRYSIYDATIQGSFLNTKSPITFKLKPIVFSTELGFQFTSNRFNFRYAIHYHTKKLQSIQVPSGNFYGNIQINYLFN